MNDTISAGEKASELVQESSQTPDKNQVNNESDWRWSYYNDQELEDRALRAYFRAADKEGLVALLPSRRATCVAEGNGKTYVMLCDGGYNVLAAFRLRSTGILKRLRCWPKSLFE